jgi:hypothetical protein
MSRFATIRWIRGLIPLAIILVLLALVSVVAFVSLIGLPPSVIRMVEDEAANHGIDLRVTNIRLGFGSDLTVTATGITVFPDCLPGGKPIATVEQLSTEIPLSDLINGVVNVKRLEIQHLNASVPVDMTAVSKQRYVQIKDLSGTCLLSNPRLLEVPSLSGQIQGMNVKLSGRMALPESGIRGLFDSDQGGIEYKEALDSSLEQMQKFQWDPANPPTWQITVSDERQTGGTLRASVQMECSQIGYNQLQLKDVDLSVGYSGGMLLVRKLICSGMNSVGQLQLTARVDLTQQVANISVDSSIPFLQWMADATGSEYPLPFQIKLESTPFLTMGAEIAFSKDWGEVASIKAMGNASVGQFRIDNELFQRVSGDFHYDNGKFYLSNFTLVRGEDYLKGKVLGENQELKLDITSTLRAETIVGLARAFANYQIDIPEQLELRGYPEIHLVGDLKFPNGWSGVPEVKETSVSLNLKDFQLYDIELGNLDIQAEIRDDKVILNHCQLDYQGHQLDIKGQGFGKEIYFAVTSNFPPKVLEELLKSVAQAPDKLTLPETATFHAFGYLNLNDEKYWGIRLLHVTAEAQKFAWNKEPFDSLSTEFKFESGKLMVQNFVLNHAKGQQLELFANGDLDGLFYLSGHNTMDLHVWDRLLNLEDDDFFMERFAFNDNSRLDLNFHGSIKPQEPTTHYDIEASLTAKNLEYKKVSISQAQTRAHILPDSATLTGCSIVYDNTNFLSSRKIRGGPSKSTLTAQSVRFVFDNDTVETKGIEGTVYPDYALRMFSEGATRALSSFLFTRPVVLTGDGVFPIEDDLSLMKGKIRFKAYQGQVEYPLLGTTLKMTNSSGVIDITPEWVHINNLTGGIWGGQFSAKIDAQIDHGDALNGAVTAGSLNLAQIGQSYEEELPEARVDGSISFRSKNGAVNSIKASGEALLSNGNLVEIPLFGKLGQVLSLIPGIGQFINFNLNRAQGSYVIEDGYLKTNSFVAKGSNMSLEGGGWVRLSDLQVNSDLRFGLRGLPGLLTSPIFLTFGRWIRVSGVGPLSNVKWSLSPFSSGSSEIPSEKASANN